MPGVFVDDSNKYIGVGTVVFVVSGVVLLIVFGGFFYFVAIVGAVWIFMGLLLLLQVIKATVTVDETKQELRVHTVRAYVCGGSETVYPLANVYGAELQAQAAARGGRTYHRVAIHTTTGIVTWNSWWSYYGYDIKHNFVTRFNQYLSTVRGGAPIVIPGVSRVNILVMVPGGAVPVGGGGGGAPQQQSPHSQQQMPPGQYPVAQMQFVPNGMPNGMPNAPAPQYQYNPYAAQPQPTVQASAPPPYSAVLQQQGTTY